MVTTIGLCFNEDMKTKDESKLVKNSDELPRKQDDLYNLFMLCGSSGILITSCLEILVSWHGE